MESTSSLLKSVIVAEAQYSSHKIERNLVFLQRQIDVLINKTSRGSSLKFFNPGDVLPAECIGCLVNILSDAGTKSTLVLKCILLFNNLVADNHIRECLHEKFQLTPALVNVIRNHGSQSADTLTAEALYLLQKITYGHRISFQETYMEDLVRFILSHICSPSTGLTQSSMGILVNLARDNFSVQSYIKNHENVQDLARVLTKLLTEENQTVMLLSLALLLNVCLQDKMGSKFYSQSNAPRTIQMVFNILIDGDSGEMRKYAVDLFKDMLKVEKLQKSLANFEFIGSCLDQTVHLLTSSSPDSVVKVFEFLQALCHVDGVRRVVCKCMFATFPIQDQSQFSNLLQTPLSRIADPLLAAIHWAGQSTDTHGLAPLGAYDLLIEIYEELVFSHDNIHHEKHLAAILPTVINTLNVTLEGDNVTIQKKCATIVRAMKLMLTLSHNDNLLTLISKQLDSNLLAKLLRFQFDNNTVTRKSNVSPPTDDWSMTGVDLVLYMLDVIARLKNEPSEKLFFKTMQEAAIVPFLACGLCSSDRQRVQQTFSLVMLSFKLEGFPSIILADELAYHNAERQNHQQNFLSHPVCPHPKKRIMLEDKENMVPGAVSVTSAAFSKDVAPLKEVSADGDSTSESIQTLIDKMNNGLGVKDNKLSEILAVYEMSLKALQTKEQNLQDLLEAKTLALTQADRMLSQYRARKGQDEAESNRLRSLLMQSEARSDNLEGDISELRNKLDKYSREIDDYKLENQKLQQIAQMHQQLTAVHTELSTKYDSVHKAYQTMRQEHKSLSEMHEMLQKHNTNLKQQYDTAMEQLNCLTEERRKISTQLKSTETKLDDMKKAAMKWEYEYKRSEEERDTMEISIEKLRTDISKSETKKKQLQDQVSQLEFALNQHEAKISSYESEIKDLKTEISKHRHIAALINSLSSGSNESNITNQSKAE